MEILSSLLHYLGHEAYIKIETDNQAYQVEFNKNGLKRKHPNSQLSH